jgi:uncharacterized protein YkwD
MDIVPRCVRSRLVLLLIVVPLLLSACARSGPNRADPVVDHDLERLHVLLNAARDEGRMCSEESFPAAEPLALHPDLMEAAQRHSDDMHVQGFLGHTGSDDSEARDRVERTGYAWSLLGEVVARGFLSPEAVLEAWLASPSHCRIVMRADYTELGMGVAGTSWTLLFARPQ